MSNLEWDEEPPPPPWLKPEPDFSQPLPDFIEEDHEFDRYLAGPEYWLLQNKQWPPKDKEDYLY